MPELSDDEITALAIAQALREVPEPTREQAHDAVCAVIGVLAWNGFHADDGIDSPRLLTTIRHLEHATRLLRAQELAITELRAALAEFIGRPGNDFMLLVDAIGKVLDDYYSADAQEPPQ